MFKSCRELYKLTMPAAANSNALCKMARTHRYMLFHLCATDQDQRAGQRMAGTGNGHFFEMPTIGDAEDITAISRANSWHFARALCHLN